MHRQSRSRPVRSVAATDTPARRLKPPRSAAVEDSGASRSEARDALVFDGEKVAIEDNRTDLAGIFIPDVLKVDLSTVAARMAGNGPDAATALSDAGFYRLSVFGGDTLQSDVQAGLAGDGMIAGGWPNGRRFGDDVVDNAISALTTW